jgi:MFS superfamily sulfate permease-like transporter
MNKSAAINGLQDIWAGALSACVFLGEFAGYGVALGVALSAIGYKDAYSIAMCMVFLPVLINALLSAFGKSTIVSGPRAASVMVLVSGITYLGTRSAYQLYGLSISTCLSIIVMTGGLTQLLALIPRVKSFFMTLPLAVTRGFFAATAISIIAGVVKSQLFGCLVDDPSQAAYIYFVSVIVFGIYLPQRFSGNPKTKPYNTLLLPSAIALSWGLVALFKDASGGIELPHCSTLASNGPAISLNMESILSVIHHTPSIGRLNLDSMATLGMTMLFGLALGAIAIVESMTTIECAVKEPAYRLEASDVTRFTWLVVIANLVCGWLALSPTTWSTSRSVLIREVGAKSRLAPLSHGVLLFLIVLFFGNVIFAHANVLVLSVALSIVGLNMLDKLTISVHVNALSKGKEEKQAPSDIVWFWLVIGLFFATHQTIIAFLIVASAYTFVKSEFAKKLFASKAEPVV